MSLRFRLSHRLDEDRNRLYFIMRGEFDSRAFVDGVIDVYSRIDRPWRYDRIFDYRHSTGTPDFAELERLSQWWAELTAEVDYHGPVAILTTDALDRVRAPTADKLFPKDIRQVFAHEGEALDWFATLYPNSGARILPSQFRISHRIDPETNLLLIAVRGRYDSEAFVQGLINLYKSIGHPWSYDRILDMRSAEGVVELADLMRASKWLAEAAGTPPPPRKRLALISSDPFDRARINALGDAFPKAYIQLFDSRDEALEWLSTPSE